MTSLAPAATRSPLLPPPETLPAWAAPVPLAARTELDQGLRARRHRRPRPRRRHRRPAGRALHGRHGSIRVRKEHVDALPGRSRHAHLRSRLHRRCRPRDAVGPRADPPPAGAVGFVFQAYNLLPTLDAKENITLPLALAGRRPDRAWLRTVVETVGLGDRLSHRPSELSGGQQQRVAVARALASGLTSSSPTSRLATSTPAPAARSSPSCAPPSTSSARRSSWSPTTPSPPAHADTVLFLEDGRLVDSMADPTPERILDRMKDFG